jgi:toxin ParE1/3/4
LKFRLSSAAEADLDNIAKFTVANFGAAQANSYRALILLALESIAEQPLRPSSHAHDEVSTGLRSFRVALAGPRLSMASHSLWYLEPAPGADTVFVVRILHKRMDPERHLSQLISGEPK